MVPQLTIERRRHWRISFGIMLGCLVSGIAVSNERGVFVPLHDLANTLAVTARAFAALASPPGRTLLEPYENLLLSDAPVLPPAAPADETPQAMMSRVLDTPPEQPSPSIFLTPPPAFGPLAPITFSPIQNVPALTPFKPLPPFIANAPVVLQRSPSGPVPEPSSWAMLIAGFAAIGWVQRRIARKAHRAAA